MAAIIPILFFVLISCSYTIEGQEINKKPDIAYLKGDDKTNQIPYFDHRFRLDSQLDEITLIFYRKAGSVPVILVRPDGSKLRVNNYPKDRVQWYDDVTYDMIKIKKPMPGPWQVIGNISPDSEIFVVSDVKIVVEPLPDVILAGETLKVEGKLLNGDLAINNPLFRDVVQLEVEFISTNNAAYENFGSETLLLTTFRDDGQELDEYAGDGIFTGEFELTIPAGEWIPVYRVKLPMATRELRQNPIMLQKNPVSISVDIAREAESFHQVHFTIDPTYVDPDSFIFQGKITFPDRQSEPFSIMEGKGVKRSKQFGYTEPGVHRIIVNAFGKTINGREFRLVVPEFTFNVDISDDELLAHISEINSNNDKALSEEELKAAEALARQEFEAEQQALQAEKQKKQWIIIGIGNLLIIIIGLGTFMFLQRKKLTK
jgi:uncharacterized protein (TIGR03503 family)